MKTYVDVECTFNKNGHIKPTCIIWYDGTKYPIERITQVVAVASIYQDGTGLRYTCKFGNNLRYLFFEDGKWFVEKMKA